MSYPVIVVFGATGAQGGAVLKALVQGNETTKLWEIRAVTRNVNSDRAKALAKQGCQVVAADLSDKDAVAKALEGAYGVFLLTSYFVDFKMETEIGQGKLVTDACKAAGIKHLVYSGLENVKDNPKVAVPCNHFDAKAVVEDYIKKSGVPYTFVRYSYYAENILTYDCPKKDGDKWVLGIPMEGVAMDMLITAESGQCVRTVFNNPGEWINKTVGLSSDKMTIPEYCEVMSRVLGRNIVATPVTAEVFGTFGFPGAEEFSAMYQFYIKGSPDRDVAATKKLHPNMPNFEKWLLSKKDIILAGMDKQ